MSVKLLTTGLTKVRKVVKAGYSGAHQGGEKAELTHDNDSVKNAYAFGTGMSRIFLQKIAEIAIPKLQFGGGFDLG